MKKFTVTLKTGFCFESHLNNAIFRQAIIANNPMEAAQKATKKTFNKYISLFVNWISFNSIEVIEHHKKHINKYSAIAEEVLSEYGEELKIEVIS